MATGRDVLKSWFETGKKPTQLQFAALIEAFYHKDEDTLPAAYTDEMADVRVAVGIIGKENAGVASGLITAIKDGVAAGGDTLQKLYNLYLGSISEVKFDTIAERDAYEIIKLPTNVFVKNDGDGKWALYMALTIGVGADYHKLSDADQLNAMISSSAIKISYESNENTNCLTNDLKQAIEDFNAWIAANSESLLNKVSFPGFGLTHATAAYGDHGHDLSGKQDLLLPPSEQTATSYTLALRNLNEYLRCNNVSPITITVPLNATVPFSVGSVITIEQEGDGVITLVGEAGVTLNGAVKTGGKSKVVQVIKVDNTIWTVIGGVI